VPPEIIPTSKRGFAIPLADWLRTGWKDTCASSLFDQPLYPDGLFDRAAVERYWNNHQSGQTDNKWGIWTLLGLQWWAQTHLASAGAGNG
jgi:asparagine synthase (glutamine-hydrolysing)